jgi:hypothetical protein
MPQDRPDIPNLLNTVCAYLGSLAPHLEPKQRFDALISRHLLDIVVRELRFGDSLAQEDMRERSKLLNSRGVGNEDADLCTAIRCGDFDQRWEDLIASLGRIVSRKCWIVRPEHLAEADRKAVSAALLAAQQVV